jgi:hypothetical protein
MFRWVRTAYHTPCPAKEKLRQKPRRGAADARPLSSCCKGGLIQATFISVAACRAQLALAPRPLSARYPRGTGPPVWRAWARTQRAGRRVAAGLLAFQLPAGHRGKATFAANFTAHQA